MSEAPENNPNVVLEDEDDPNWFMTTVVGVAGSLIVVACVYLVSAIFYGVEDGLVERTVVEAEYKGLEEYRAEQAAKLKDIDRLKDEWLKNPR